jgi:hypothetical protein
MSGPTNTHDSEFTPAHIQKQLDEIKEALRQQNAVLMEQNRVNLEQEKTHAEIKTLLENVKGFLTVMGWFQWAVVFTAKMVAAVGVVWAAFKYLVKESISK